MQYTKITVTLTPYNETASELMVAQMGDLGFDTFADTDNGFEAYIPSKNFSPELMESLSTYVEGVAFSWSQETIEDQNWNKVWEENYFKPIVIGNRCLIRSTFHPKETEAEYEIIINPQMAFGTGHHETTSLMMQFLLDTDLAGQTVLDMGCGTGILGIMASMRGAKQITGIDIDEWCYNNSMENLQLNGITNMSVAVGDANALPQEPAFDTILANINRNILLADMDKYTRCLRSGGTLIMSGFYSEDCPLIQARAEQLGYSLADTKQENNWCSMKFTLRK